jgi:hypothetical protein
MILDCLAVVRWHNKLQNPHSRPRSSVVADKHLSSVEQTDNSPNCVQVSSCWWGLEGYPGIWTSPPECLSIVKQSDGFPEVCCLVADRYKTADRTMMATQILCSHMKGSYLSACGLALIGCTRIPALTLVAHMVRRNKKIHRNLTALPHLRVYFRS